MELFVGFVMALVDDWKNTIDVSFCDGGTGAIMYILNNLRITNLIAS